MSALVLFLAKATLVLVGAYVAATSLRRSTAGARHLVWVGALAAVIALPLLARYGPVRLEVLPMRTVNAVTAPNTAGGTAPSVRRSAASRTTDVGTGSPAAEGRESLRSRWSSVALPSSRLTTIAIVWGAITAALLGWLLIGSWSVRRILRGSRELTTPDWTTPLCEVADRLDLAEIPRLVASDRIEMAFACNPVHPTIVLPATADGWSDDRRRAVLLHELAHVRRHDLFGHTIGRVACAIYWFHPLVWTAAKRLRAESERACDDLVLTCGARPSEYAQHLLDMVTSVRNYGAPATALPMARKKEFEGRMLAILDPAIRRAAPGRLQSALLVAVLAVLSLSIAAVAPARTAAPREMPLTAPLSSAAAPSPQPTATGAPASKRVVDGPQTHTEEHTTTRPNTLTTLVESLVNSAVRNLPISAMAGMAVPQQVAGDTGRIAVFIKVLRTDTDGEIRKTAAWALSEAQTDAALRALLDALKSDTDAEVREMSAWVLSYRGDAVVGPLADALKNDKSAEVRETAAWALGTMNARDQASLLASALKDPSSEVRHTAAWAIGSFGGRTAPPGLAAGLKDKDDEVRHVTAWALGQIADVSTANALIDAFGGETSSEVRSAELRAISIMGKATPSIIEMALASKDTDLRRQGVTMLAGKSGTWPWPWPWPRPRPSP